VNEANIPKSQRPEWIDGLPPAEAWIKDRNEKMETPVDDRGLVDVPRLIEGVASYVHPNYLWYDNPSDHHLGWPRSRYVQAERQSNGLIPAERFRELPTQRIWMPRMPHTLTHAVTIPPPMPDAEVMYHAMEAWDVAANLLTSLGRVNKVADRVAAELDRIDNTEERERIILEYQATQFARHFKGQLPHLDRMGDIPQEHWVFDPNDDPRNILRKIGSIMSRSYRRINGEVIYTSRGRRRISLASVALKAASQV
jgi:hypothetical protein